MEMVFDNYIVGTFLVSLFAFLFLFILRHYNNNNNDNNTRKKRFEKGYSREFKIQTGTGKGECSPGNGSGDEVIIVGAGVAGAALAYTLGKFESLMKSVVGLSSVINALIDRDTTCKVQRRDQHCV
ncbi:hypothetical protein PVK06_005972 [Gossypium arboreum]|uniref:Squalene monooxygenase n=1 Tax=Gossypium arboreum TaxID=29729 RepID=A0ABR0QW68_GOSAR|nr:hypothetical protein PVK06_005972 [Gossypium arboreum]